jgi:cohesin loading factor subunit SCC2
MEKDAAYKIALREHVALIIHTVKSGNVTAILDKIFESILDPDPKPTPATNGLATTAMAQTHNPSFVCAQFVEAMFDFISNMDGEDTTIPSGKDALNVLHIFAKADPALFTYEQISVLKPYLALSQKPPNEELVVFRSVALVYRRVLPHFSAAMYKDFLVEVRTKFLAAVGKVAKQLLDEVIACIWIISDHLKSLFSLVRMSCSSIGNLKKFQKAPLERLDRAVLERLKMYMLIVGFVGKHARLEDELATFQKAEEVTPFPPKCETVSRLMLHHLLPFADSSKPHDIRQAALEAMGLICQSNPRNYVLPFVYTALQSAFDDQDPGLEDVVMRSF